MKKLSTLVLIIGLFAGLISCETDDPTKILRNEYLGEYRGTVVDTEFNVTFNCGYDPICECPIPNPPHDTISKYNSFETTFLVEKVKGMNDHVLITNEDLNREFEFKINETGVVYQDFYSSAIGYPTGFEKSFVFDLSTGELRVADIGYTLQGECYGDDEHSWVFKGKK